MLSEVLSALKGLKAELQEQLARQPEYRALLIVDRATSQLGDAPAVGDERGSPGSESPAQTEAAAPRPGARGAGRLVVVHDAAVDVARSEPPGAPAPAPREAQTETPPQGSDASFAANERAGALPARPATIADFAIAALQDGAQGSPADATRDGDSANAPASRAADKDLVDSATASPLTNIVSATAALDESTGELLGAAHDRDGVGAAPASCVEDHDPLNAPVNLVAADEVGDAQSASSQSETISGLAALYASAGEFPDTAHVDDDAAPTPTETVSGMTALHRSADRLPDAEGAGATLPATAAEDARWASMRASLVHADDVVDVAPAPPPAQDIPGFAALYESAAEDETAVAPMATASGLTAALYESTGDAPDLESEALAPVRTPAVEAPVETAMEAFNRTLADAAEVAEAAKFPPLPTKAPSPRGFLPVFTAQRLAQSRG